jgi:hypothetical protein
MIDDCFAGVILGVILLAAAGFYIYRRFVMPNSKVSYWDMESLEKDGEKRNTSARGTMTRV